ncbi:PTS glucitol/sorbitol transporter subunit IIA [Pectinatus sottacetonis]|uniref:PTS glucitol/sorbitol transporter subunit IIA n=1 Tax=Pectinatus sottacetonis TaxID=1002795 RepID=UPI001E5CA634|nr:PTS glucitol/sorbitol transporter subunit IIA [Pectinatus sottacetonis]
MLREIYSTTVSSLGPLVKDFITENLIILFNKNAPPELAEFCVLHEGNNLSDIIESGDILKIENNTYKIVYVGGQVQKNLQDLGHISLKFNNNADKESLEGSIYLENKPIFCPSPGNKIKIIKTE